MKEKPEKFRLERDSNPGLRDAGAVLQKLSYQANWELVIMRVNHKPVDSEYICDEINEISFELQMETKC